MLWIAAAAAVLCAGLALSGCKPDRLPGEAQGAELRPGARAAAETDRTEQRMIARVGRRVITLDEVERRLEDSSLIARERMGASARRMDLLEAIIDMELYAHDALRRGLGDSEEVELHAMLNGARAFLRRGVPIGPPIEDEELREIYEERIDEFRIPERVELIAFVFDDLEAAQAFREELEWEKATSPEIAGLVVERVAEERKSSDPDSVRILGLSSAVQEGVPREVRRLSFTTDRAVFLVDGEFEERDGRVAIWWIGLRTGELDISFEEARAWLREEVTRRRRAEAARAVVDELRSRMRVEIDEEAVAGIREWRRAESVGSESEERPRWFSPEALAELPELYAGHEQIEEIRATRVRLGDITEARERAAALESTFVFGRDEPETLDEETP